MIATVYLKPCPICPKGKNCKGHVSGTRPLGLNRIGIEVVWVPEDWNK